MVNHTRYGSPTNNAKISFKTVLGYSVRVNVVPAMASDVVNVYVSCKTLDVTFSVTHDGQFIKLVDKNVLAFKTPLFTRLSEIHSLVRTHIKPELREVILYAIGEHRAMINLRIGI